MSLITLSGTISGSDLNNNFNDKLSSLATKNEAAGKDIQYDTSVLDLATSTNVGIRTCDFTVPTDLQLITLGLSIFNPDATIRSATLRLQAIAEDETAVSKYVDGLDVFVRVEADSASEFSDRLSADFQFFLVKGVTYRLIITRDDANGGVIDRAYGFALCRTFKRRI